MCCYWIYKLPELWRTVREQTDRQTDRKVKTKITSNYICYLQPVIIGGPSKNSSDKCNHNSVPVWKHYTHLHCCLCGKKKQNTVLTITLSLSLSVTDWQFLRSKLSTFCLAELICTDIWGLIYHPWLARFQRSGRQPSCR